MKCPNCSKKPVGLFPGFRLKRVGVRKAIRGYFKCRHCGTLLKQVVESGIAQYQKTYWYAQVGFLFVILLTAWLSFYLTNNYPVLGFYPVYGFLAFGVLLVGYIDSFVKPRYWIIEEVDHIKEKESAQGFTKRGWSAFIFYTVTVIALAVGLPEIFEGFHFSKWTVLAIILVYCTAAIAGGVYIVATFSGSASE